MQRAGGLNSLARILAISGAHADRVQQLIDRQIKIRKELAKSFAELG